MSRAIGRREFLRMMVITEGALIVLAVLLAWVEQGRPWPFAMAWSPQALAWGVVAALPPLVLVVLLYGPFIRLLPPVHRAAQAIVERMDQLLRAALMQLGMADIVLLSLAAGFAEELFFRGALQPWLGWWAASIIFGALHALTPLYFLLATAIGSYFGWLYQYTGNLLVPMLAHAAYDITALLLLQRLLQQRPPGAGPPSTPRGEP